jgi:glutamate racemase
MFGEVLAAPDQTAVESAAQIEQRSERSLTSPTVGIFDSGIGGFTVAASIVRRRADLNLVYFGDTLNMPYGGRPLSQLAGFARNNIEFLLSQGIDILAVGCNASNSALGQGELKSFGVPVYDLVSSTVEWLRRQSEPIQRIALVATEAAVNSGYWKRKLLEAQPDLDVIPVAAPEFVPLVEAHQQDHDANREAVRKYLHPLIEQEIYTVLHGCTHYPFLQSYMEELSTELRFIDPAECLAERLIASLGAAAPGNEHGELRLFSSLPGEAFYAAGERTFGRPIRRATSMYIVNPSED